jgi:hypothetical protein
MTFKLLLSTPQFRASRFYLISIRTITPATKQTITHPNTPPSLAIMIVIEKIHEQN